ncbi:MAG: DUF1385 domain-containing protein [Syntrophomonadaceae bacterium]|nr:DUF1385 domain-containing protein [Syntrophomonadaceae bacterium]
MGSNFQYGGQAVIEGVMMRGPSSVAVAVRKPDGEIVVETQPQDPPWKRNRFLSLPFIRGTVVLIDSLIIGVRSLNRSAVLTEEEEPLTDAEIFWTGVIAAVLAIVLFLVVPTGVVHYTRDIIGGVWAQNLVEGILRILIFLGYIIAISYIEDIKRVFMYHGAEHKVIHTLEAGYPLSVENARDQSILHPRCGTSFLLLVMILSIIVFAALGEGSLWWRVLSRLAVLPVVAGLGYELIKLTSRHADRPWAICLMTPGLWLQKLTTAEPDEAQMEVALEALKAVVPTTD